MLIFFFFFWQQRIFKERWDKESKGHKKALFWSAIAGLRFVPSKLLIPGYPFERTSQMWDIAKRIPFQITVLLHTAILRVTTFLPDKESSKLFSLSSLPLPRQPTAALQLSNESRSIWIKIGSFLGIWQSSIFVTLCLHEARYCWFSLCDMFEPWFPIVLLGPGQVSRALTAYFSCLFGSSS